MKTEILVWIRPEDYDAFRTLLGDDLPPSFDEWRENAEKLSAQADARGIGINRVQVSPDEYVRYCKASGLDTNDATLGAFAVYKAYKR